MNAPANTGELNQRIDALIAAKPDGVLEAMAQNSGASLLQVMQRLPGQGVKLLPAEKFDDVWNELRGWGEVLFIVHTEDIVLECVGTLPEGSHGHGYFNIHGDSPIGGHIKAANCEAIALVDRPFHGKRSCSIQFLNTSGNAMFKVFVRRDSERQLLTEQLGKFEALSNQGLA